MMRKAMTAFMAACVARVVIFTVVVTTLTATPPPALAQTPSNRLLGGVGASTAQILAREQSRQRSRTGALARAGIQPRLPLDSVDRQRRVIERYEQRQRCLEAAAATNGQAICRLVRP